MMQQKNEQPQIGQDSGYQEPAEKVVSVNLRKMFGNLPEHDQVAVTTFFNLHNAAMFVFNDLTKDAQEYCEFCIKMSQEKIKH